MESQVSNREELEKFLLQRDCLQAYLLPLLQQRIDLQVLKEITPSQIKTVCERVNMELGHTVLFENLILRLQNHGPLNNPDSVPNNIGFRDRFHSEWTIGKEIKDPEEWLQLVKTQSRTQGFLVKRDFNNTTRQFKISCASLSCQALLYASYKTKGDKIVMRQCISEHNHKRLTRQELLQKLRLEDISPLLLNKAYGLFIKGEDPSDIKILLRNNFCPATYMEMESPNFDDIIKNYLYRRNKKEAVIKPKIERYLTSLLSPTFTKEIKYRNLKLERIDYIPIFNFFGESWNNKLHKARTYAGHTLWTKIFQKRFLTKSP